MVRGSAAGVVEINERTHGNQRRECGERCVVVAEVTDGGLGLEALEFEGKVALLFGQETPVAESVLELFRMDRGQRQTRFAEDIVFAAIETAESPERAEKAHEDLGLERAVGLQLAAQVLLEDCEVGFFVIAQAELFRIDAVFVGVLCCDGLAGRGSRSGLHASAIARGLRDFVLSRTADRI